MESFVLQSGIVSGSLQVILDRFSTFAETHLGILLGVDDELRKLERTLLKVQALIDSVKNQHQRTCSHVASKHWLRDLQNVLHDADDFLDEIALELAKLSSKKASAELTNPEQVRNLVLSRFHFSLPSQVVNMQRKLEGIAKEMDGAFINEVVKMIQPTNFNWKLQTSSLVDESYVVGRGNDKTEVVKMLLSEETGRELFISVIAVVGMAGIGKTTLAQLVYNDKNVVDKFDLRIWVSISADHSIERIAKSIVESVNGKMLKLSDLDPIQIMLQKLLAGKKVLIVLDDMWDENPSHWDALRLPFKVTARGSKVLVTTQSVTVSNIVATSPPYHVHTLSDEDCWALIKQRAFSSVDIDQHNDWVEIGQKIAEKCKGLPLAARVLGSVLRFKSDKKEWDAILNSKIWELPETQNELLPALKLSYDLLPHCFKRCFAYCSIFPPNFEFIQDDLAQLWVAEGFVQPKPMRRIEDIGKEYFDILLLRSFFQFSHFDHNNQSIYKMHHLIHELAQFVCDELCFRMEDNNYMSLQWSNFRNARHSSFICNGNNYPRSLQLFHKCNRLRTFMLLPSESGISHIDQISCDLFLSLGCVRVLNLSYSNITELPDSIGTLKHLRYLNVSNTHIEKLPESMTNLYGLETLKLKNCFNLLQLPRNMRNLTNLRHLELDIKRQISFMPLEFGKLTNLQTLSAFVVGKEAGQRIEELQNMSFLHGSICITNLENVVDVKEAVTAKLDRKLYLDKVELQWNEINYDIAHSAEQVLAGLRPHYKIKELIISGYGGFMFPSWLGDPSFNRVESIYLHNCRHCRFPPELYRLPALKTLYIHGMQDLPLLPVSMGFPSLESLTLHDMLNLQRFGVMPGAGAMPRLRRLTIVDCPNLDFLPQLHYLSYLENLEITRCPRLQRLPNEGLPNSLKSLVIVECDILKERYREDYDMIRTIQRVEIDYEPILNANTSS